jgi:hypothetical protein
MRRLQFTNAGVQFLSTNPGSPLSMYAKENCYNLESATLPNSPGLRSFDPNLLTHLNKLTVSIKYALAIASL